MQRIVGSVPPPVPDALHWFTVAGDVTTSGVATFTDGAYGTLGGFAYYGEPGGANIVALAYAGSSLYAAGDFTSVAGVEAQHWARYDGTAWSVPAALDNAVAESFFGTLQVELLDEHRKDTKAQLALALFEWIKAWSTPTAGTATTGCSPRRLRSRP